MQGEQLKAMRKAVGMTQQQLGDALGLSAGYIGELQRGEKTIDAKLELAISAAVERHGVHPFAISEGYDSSGRYGFIIHRHRRAVISDLGYLEGYSSMTHDTAFDTIEGAKSYARQWFESNGKDFASDPGVA